MKVHEILDLTETLSTTVDVVTTKVSKHAGYLTYISVLKTNPEITVVIRLTEFENLTVGDVVFFPSKSKSFAAVYTFGTKGALAIFNTVSKLCEAHVKEVDAWFFTAKFSEDASAKEFEKRTDLYDRLAVKIAQRNSLMGLRHLKIGQDKVYIVSKEKVTDKNISDFVNYCSGL